MIPKETVSAAFPREIKIGGLTLRALTLQHVLALQAIDHPLMRQPAEGGEGIPVALPDQLIAVTLLSMAPAELARMLSASATRADFLQRAYLAAAEIPVAEIGKLVSGLRSKSGAGSARSCR